MQLSELKFIICFLPITSFDTKILIDVHSRNVELNMKVDWNSLSLYTFVTLIIIEHYVRLSDTFIFNCRDPLIDNMIKVHVSISILIDAVKTLKQNTFCSRHVYKPFHNITV